MECLLLLETEDMQQEAIEVGMVPEVLQVRNRES